MLTYRVNGAYRFSLMPTFAAFDGEYELLSVLTYDEVVEAGVDLKSVLYDPAGSSAFDTDLPNLRKDQILKLRKLNVSEETIVYIPEMLLSGMPDSDVHEYQELSMAIKLGEYVDPDELATFASDVREMVMARLGVTEDVLLYTSGTVWRTLQDHQDTVDAREAAKTETDNHYTQNKALEEENTRLKSLVADYENTLIQLNGG